MRKAFLINFVFLFAVSLIAQNSETKIHGEVTYITSSNIYVSFANTAGFNKGDTLYIEKDGELVSAIEVKYLSSSSCAGSPLIDIKNFSKSMQLVGFIKNPTTPLTQQIIADSTASRISPKSSAVSGAKNITKQNIRGKFSIASYTDLVNFSSGTDNIQRWRYTFSLNAEKVYESDFSFDMYSSYSYKNNQRKRDLFENLKIYSLSAQYDFTPHTRLNFGRLINPAITNIGAFDGLQFETEFGNINSGFILGSRPSFSNYSFDGDLFQYGFYLSKTDTIGTAFMQNSVSLFEQTNKFNTDRRFLYFQHSNNVLSNVNVFISAETDIYKRVSGAEKFQFDITGLYISTRYQPINWASFNASYDARKNVMYYETYKHYADSLLESETRKGLRISTNLRLIKNLFLRLGYGYRFGNSDLTVSNNYNFMLSYNNLPWLNSSANLSFNQINTSFVDGTTWGIGLGKSFFDNDLDARINYRIISYSLLNSMSTLSQNIFNLDLSYRVFGRDYVSISYDGTFEKLNTYSRIYFNFTKRI
ncbi:MAG: hypothetical protein ABIG69_06405 [Bacteroidota bacterium]